MVQQKKPKKTLEQLTKDVLDTGLGIPDEDLDLLFSDDDPVAGLDADGRAQLPGGDDEPGQAPATGDEPIDDGSASYDGEGEPASEDPLELIPEKFRDADIGSSLKKWGDSTVELETKLASQGEQIAELQETIAEFTRKMATGQRLTANQQQQMEDAQAQLDALYQDIDDSMIIESPKEIVLKLIRGEFARILPTAFQNYDIFVTKRQYADKFRSEHPDFDALRPLMREVVSENPTLNDDVYALPRIYGEAKKRAARQPQPVETDRQKLIEELRKELLPEATRLVVEGIKKRRNAQGVTTGSAPVSPQDRQRTQPKTQPKTAADIAIDEMLAAGPRKLDLVK